MNPTRDAPGAVVPLPLNKPQLRRIPFDENRRGGRAETKTSAVESYWGSHTSIASLAILALHAPHSIQITSRLLETSFNPPLSSPQPRARFPPRFAGANPSNNQLRSKER